MTYTDQAGPFNTRDEAFNWNGTLTLTASGGSTDTATVSVRSERDYR